ncbi:hypothetical protein Hanom_Chr03g00249761 [Helianthus anomalus]
MRGEIQLQFNQKLSQLFDMLATNKTQTVVSKCMPQYYPLPRKLPITNNLIRYLRNRA